jgi:hypothetical protein
MIFAFLFLFCFLKNNIYILRMRVQTTYNNCMNIRMYTTTLEI